jgi:hypothetical protein
MSSGAPTAANSQNCALNTVASRHRSGGQASRGGASSTRAKDGPRLSAAMVTASTDQKGRNRKQP